MNDANLLIGWRDIAEYLGVSRSTVLRRRRDMVRYGVIFYRLSGSPPKREVAAYKPKIREWITSKTKKGGYL